MYQAMRNFFWFCAGVNKRLLLECDTDFSKYFCIGAAVFFTAVFAALSSAYALFFVFSGSPNAIWAALGFGLIWGLTIFNIDRYLVLSIKKENKPWKEFWTALPRILLAIMIGIVIARPLELKIFDKEIKDGLKQYYLENQKQTNQTANEGFLSKNQILLDQLKTKTGERDIAKTDLESAQKLRDAECYGKILDHRTTGIWGDGPNCKIRNNEVLIQSKIYTDLVTDVTDLQTQLNNSRQASGLNTPISMNQAHLDSIVDMSGFFDRNKMLGQISSWTPFNIFSGKSKDEPTANPKSIKIKKSDSSSTTSNPTFIEANKGRLTQQRFDGENDKTGFFISMLFICMECLPIIVKLMSRRGMYDVKLDEEEGRVGFLTRNETYANKHIVHQLALAQKEVLTSAIKQWKEKEMGRDNLSDGYINSNPDNKP